jgi:hypothetical protein
MTYTPTPVLIFIGVLFLKTTGDASPYGVYGCGVFSKTGIQI